MAEACGMLHASTALLVRLIGRVLKTEAWQGFGVRSAEQWVAWKCGVSPGRARRFRDELSRAGEAGPGPGASPADVSWADAFVAVAEKSLAAVAVVHPHRDRDMVLLHVGTKGGHLHLGPGVSDGLRRYIGCDSRVRPVFEEAGRVVSVGRAFRTVPGRTRIAIEDRDRGGPTLRATSSASCSRSGGRPGTAGGRGRRVRPPSGATRRPGTGRR